mgnify:CR=1 FL=1
MKSMLKQPGKYLKVLAVLIIFLILDLFYVDVTPNKAKLPGDEFVGMGNPAAVYCLEMGYDHQILEKEEGQEGTCIFPDGEACEAWAFLEGKCGQEHSYCAQQGWGIETVKDGNNPFSQEYGVCIDQKGKKIGSVQDLAELEKGVVGCGNSQPQQILSSLESMESDQEPTLDGPSPSSFDWRDYQGINWMTPVRDQGGCGSCWAFSAVGVVEAVYNIANDDPTLDKDLSEQYLVSDCHYYPGYQTCCGGIMSLALSYIRDIGVPDESCMPYVDGGGDGCSCFGNSCDSNCTYTAGGDCSDRSCADRCGDWADRLEGVSSIGYVSPDRESIKQALVEFGPLSVSVGINSQKGGDWDGDIYRCDGDESEGYLPNHAVVIVGYDDGGGYWIVRNSWGTDWEDGGYYKVGYGECAIEEYVYYVRVEPEIELKGNQQSILNGDSTPSLQDHTDFGLLEHGGPLVRTFTIENQGFLDLKLEGVPRVQLTLPNASDFRVISNPDSIIKVGDSTTLKIEFTPQTEGLRSAGVSIPNNDSDENPFTFSVQGTADFTFADVPFDYWAYDWIEALYDAGLTTGFPDGTYKPSSPVTRAEMAVFLLKGMNSGGYSPPAPDGSHPFNDIAGHWAEGWMEELYDVGLTSGYPDGSFRPQTQVTRAEMAVFLLRSKYGASYTPPSVEPTFNDTAGHWAENWIEQLAVEGITSGYKDGSYRPDQEVTRAEVAVFLVKTFDLSLP